MEHGGVVTLVLKAAAAGDPQAATELLPLVYQELRRLARARMQHQAPGQTLQPTALVHEAYMKLLGAEEDPGWEGRAHFFGAAANAMRQIIVDQARRKAARRHGGDRQRVDLEKATPVILPPTDDVLAMNEALIELEKHSPRRARLVTLHYFAGLTTEEVAATLGISPATAHRDLRYAKAWLHDHLSEHDGPKEK